MLIGTDIVDINRFKNLVHKSTFMNKVFTEQELDYIISRSNNLSTIAGMYAAKEAFLKANKKGINHYPLKDIEIIHDENNAPYILLHHDIMNDLSKKKWDVSISHDKNYAISTVIIY